MNAAPASKCAPGPTRAAVCAGGACAGCAPRRVHRGSHRSGVVVVAVAGVLTCAALAAGCVRVEPGAYLCDARGACPAPLVCAAGRCVEPGAVDAGAADAGAADGGAGVDGGAAVDAGEVDAGAVDAGAVDAGGDAGSFVTVAAGDVDDEVRAVSVALDASATPHVALWSHVDVPADDRVQYATCTGNCGPGTWSFTVVKDQVAGGDPHPSLALDEQNRPRIAYSSGATLFVAVCDASCAQASSWHTAVVAANATAPRLARDGSDLVALSCVGPLASSALTLHRCAGSCASDASWSSTSLGFSGGCHAVADLTVDGARAAALYTAFDGADHLRQARCASSCAQASSWSAVTADASASDGRYRFAGASGAAFLDVGAATLATCAGCAPGLPAAGDPVVPLALDGAGDLESDGAAVDVARRAAGGAWRFGSCPVPCSAASAVGDVALVPAADVLDLVLDDAGAPHAVSAHGASLSFASPAP